MKSRILALCGLLAVTGGAITFGVSAQAGGGKERHPELVAALKSLNVAKNRLQKADRDFDGHRTKAVELTNQAIDEVKAAIASDSK